MRENEGMDENPYKPPEMGGSAESEHWRMSPGELYLVFFAILLAPILLSAVLFGGFIFWVSVFTVALLGLIVRRRSRRSFDA